MGRHFLLFADPIDWNSFPFQLCLSPFLSISINVHKYIIIFSPELSDERPK